MQDSLFGPGSFLIRLLARSASWRYVVTIVFMSEMEKTFSLRVDRLDGTELHFRIPMTCSRVG